MFFVPTKERKAKATKKKEERRMLFFFFGFVLKTFFVSGSH